MHLKGYKFWYNGIRDFRARLALIAVARTMVGSIFPSTMAPSKRGPKNGTLKRKKTNKHGSDMSPATTTITKLCHMFGQEPPYSETQYFVSKNVLISECPNT